MAGNLPNSPRDLNTILPNTKVAVMIARNRRISRPLQSHAVRILTSLELERQGGFFLALRRDTVTRRQ